MLQHYENWKISKSQTSSQTIHDNSTDRSAELHRNPIFWERSRFGAKKKIKL